MQNIFTAPQVGFSAMKPISVDHLIAALQYYKANLLVVDGYTTKLVALNEATATGATIVIDIMPDSNKLNHIQRTFDVTYVAD